VLLVDVASDTLLVPLMEIRREPMLSVALPIPDVLLTDVVVDLLFV